MDDSHDSTSSLVFTCEDFSPPPSPQVSESSNSDTENRQSDEDEDQYAHEVFGVQPYMFEPLAEAGEVAAAAVAEETQHAREGMPADQW